MSSAYCSIEDAFTGPMNPGKKVKKSKTKESDVAAPPVPDPMKAPANSTKPEAGMGGENFFPLPGETAEPEEWAKAFTLEGSNMPLQRPDGSVSVAGKSTLWRNIPVPEPANERVIRTEQPMVSDIHKRLEELSRQLEALTTTTPMQSTAELFLFIAIGLLFLLAMDTLLRFATTVALAKQGGVRLGRRWRSFR
jgi:hypothetical protein